MNKAETTRLNILNKAFELIYKNGYQATSVDQILEQTEVTKGAFYYHFKNKENMGVAMIEEVIYPNLNSSLIAPLKDTQNPLESIYKTIEHFLNSTTDHQVKYGCPTNNMIQEMAPLSSDFNKSLRIVLDRWQSTIESALENGKKVGNVNQQVDSKAAAEFIIVGYEGLRSLGKVYQDKDFYKTYLSQLKNYLNMLR